MELEEYAPLLKRMKLGMLEPELQREILGLATEMGYESTISSSSDLYFMYRIYKAGRMKEKRSAKALKRAEDMILRLSSLHQAALQQPRERREKKERPPLTLLEGGIMAGKTTRQLLNSIGIDDERVISQAEERFGEKKVGERVELVNMTSLGDELVRAVFHAHPKTILIPKDGDFIAELEAMECKRSILDARKEARGGSLPPDVDYTVRPGVLLSSFQTIARLLDIRTIPVRETNVEAEYHGKPMEPDDFMKVVRRMGFDVVREAKHGTILSNDSGGVMSVQRAHRKQMTLNTSTIKIKLVEAGINLNEFESKRQELGL